MTKLLLYQEYIEKDKLVDKMIKILRTFEGYCLLETEDKNFFILAKDFRNEYNEKIIHINAFNNKNFIKIEKVNDSWYNLITDLLDSNTPLSYNEKKERFTELYLWGIHLEENQYFENITPTVIDYPVKKTTTAKRLKLRITGYFDEYGNCVFYHFIDLVEVSDE